MLQGDLTTAYTYANYFAERKNSVSLSLQQGKRTSTESCRDLTSRCAKGDKSTQQRRNQEQNAGAIQMYVVGFQLHTFS